MNRLNALPQPEDVFDEDYWGKIVPEGRGHCHQSELGIFACSRSARHAGALAIGETIMPTLTGTEAGDPAPEGTVFYSPDSILAQHSRFNFPGAVVLYDYEALRPVSRMDQPTPEEDYPDHLRQSPRTLLATALGGALFKTIIGYSNDENKYYRSVGIACVVPTRKGTAMTFEAPFIRHGNPDKDEPHWMPLQLFSALRSGGVVGITEHHTSPDGCRRSLSRLRSLALLKEGEALKAEQKLHEKIAGWVMDLLPLRNPVPVGLRHTTD